MNATDQMYKIYEFIIILKKLKYHTLDMTACKKKEFIISLALPVFQGNQIALVNREKFFVFCFFNRSDTNK